MELYPRRLSSSSMYNIDKRHVQLYLNKCDMRNSEFNYFSIVHFKIIPGADRAAYTGHVRLTSGNGHHAALLSNYSDYSVWHVV